MCNFMNEAIDLAIKNIDEGGTPYGSVLVKDNEVISSGVNTLHLNPDISGHAELNAIRDAQKILGRTDLSDCIIYASGHPCPMCFGAIVLSGIKEIIYYNSPKDAADAGMPLTYNIYEYLKGNKEAINLKVSKAELEENQLNPMLYWASNRVGDN